MLNSIYNIHDGVGVKYLTRLSNGFSHLKEHNFRHNFQDPIDPICSCSSDIETTSQFFLHYINHNTQWKNIFDRIATIHANISTENIYSTISNQAK